MSLCCASCSAPLSFDSYQKIDIVLVGMLCDLQHSHVVMTHDIRVLWHLVSTLFLSSCISI